MISFVRDTVTRLRAGTVVDPYGNQVADWDTASSVEITGCRVQPAGGAELLASSTATGTIIRDGVRIDATLFGPPDADVTSHDRIVFGGLTFEVSGPVNRWYSPTGRLAHIQVPLSLVEG